MDKIDIFLKKVLHVLLLYGIISKRRKACEYCLAREERIPILIPSLS